MPALSRRLRDAAVALEELSAMYGYIEPSYTSWSPKELLIEADHVEADEGLAL